MIIQYSRTSLSYLQKLDKRIKKRIFEAVSKLPDHGDIVRMKGKKIKKLHRLRVGKYRILFLFEEESIKILDIDTRGDVYK